MEHDNVYAKIHSALTWKRIIAFNVVLFLVTVIPISVGLAERDTENRSSAAEAPAEVIPPPSYPTSPPSIERVSEWFGKKGDTVVVLGKSFGAYQWGSKLYVGNVEVDKTNIVRWSDSVIEVQIPESARTGKVWIVVNSRQASWDGSLLLTDVARSAQIKLTKTGQTTGVISMTNAAGVVRGMVEFSHASEPVTTTMAGGTIVSTIQSVDSLGKKTRVEFTLNSPLTSSNSQIMTVSYPGIGSLEIIRTELYDSAGRIVPVFAEPLSVKIQ